MARPTDWDVLDLDRDPVPGDPFEVKELARKLGDFADDVASALRSVRGLSGDSVVQEWAGLSGDAYRRQFGDLPGELDKLERSYRLASGALDDYWPKLETAQGDADRALAQGRTARQELDTAQSQLTNADAWVKRAQDKSKSYQEDPKPDVPPPSAEEVRAAARNATDANSAHTTASTAVHSAQAKLDAAKQLAADAAQLRDDAASTAQHALHEASDAGIRNKHWWEKAVDWVADHWDDIIAVCKVIVAVLGIVVLIIGGPLAWLVLAAAVLVLADTVMKYLKGQASLWDVLFAALDCIPMFKGLTTAGGLLKMARELPALLKSGRALENIANSVRKGVTGLREMGREFQKLITCGDPVDVATGQVVMSATDFKLPGILPVVVERHHRSTFRGGRWLGPSWSSVLDMRLILDDEGVRFIKEDGTVTHYPVPQPDTDVLPVVGPLWPLRWNGDPADGMTVHLPESGTTHHFFPRKGAAELLLRRTVDRNGNTVDVTYTPGGVPLTVESSGGYRIGVETRDGRITAMRLLSDTREPSLVTYGYDDRGNLNRTVDANGGEFSLYYDDQRRVTGWRDGRETTYTYEYDAGGRCVRAHGSEGILDYSYAYAPQEGRTVATNSLGEATEYRFNEAFQLTGITDPLGHTSSFDWDPAPGVGERLLSRTDELGRTTRFRYDEAGNVTLTARPDGATTQVEYGAFGRPVLVTHADGSTARFTYDEFGNQVSATDPLGVTTRFRYDARGALEAVIDGLGTVQQTVVNDAAGLPLTVTDGTGAVTEVERDAFGRVTFRRDATGAVTRLAWTPEGGLARRVTPDGAVDEWTYDVEGSLAEHRSATGGVTRYENTHFDLCTARTEPDGSRYEFTYDSELRLTSVVDPGGDRWSYTYDAAGRLTAETDFAGRSLTYRYDEAGQLTERVNGAGQSIAFRRDVLGNVVEQTADAERTEFQYDVLGRMTRAVGAAADVSFELDPAGRVLAERVNGRELRSWFDALGRRTRRRTPAGAVSTWTYGAGNRPTRREVGGQTVDIGYDTAGRESVRRIGADLTLTWDWRDEARATALSVTRGADGRPTTRTYEHTIDGYLEGVTDFDGAAVRFGLDSRRRVTAVTGADWSESYAYDARGALGSSRVGASRDDEAAHTYDAGPRVRSVGRSTFVHDAQGRIVQRVRRLLSGGRRTWHYSWDAADRLTELRTPDGETWRYRYDPLGRRIAKTRVSDAGDADRHTDFTWDGTRLAERTSDGTTVTWDYGDDDVPIAQTVRTTDSERPAGSAELSPGEVDERFHAIVTDLIGTPTEMVDLYGVVVWRRPGPALWGGGDGGRDDAADCPLRFPGQYYDAESGLHYNYERYYDPETARYLSPDPLGLDAGTDPYAYVLNPLNWSDPRGLKGKCLVDLYHGTTGGGLRGILANGVDTTFSTRAMDFGKGGFYVTNDLEQAQKWSRILAGRSGDVPEVVHFKVPKSELEALRSKVFNGTSDELANFIRHNRMGGAMHNYELVEGPMLLNLKAFRKGAAGVFDGHQIAVFGSKAADLFTRSLVR
ncbi:RHS repeat-associated core domain-containing protein [Streptomyces sp. NPDC003300]|uniref:RHS repeat-associated core domain-containing protein n=3 Tax=unclassified Streptomyces TaxID=2593676 RepID=UPI0033B97A84